MVGSNAIIATRTASHVCGIHGDAIRQVAEIQKIAVPRSLPGAFDSYGFMIGDLCRSEHTDKDDVRSAVSRMPLNPRKTDGTDCADIVTFV
jgi:hypothetical protein